VALAAALIAWPLLGGVPCTQGDDPAIVPRISQADAGTCSTEM
jgi:hypothetical protein